MPIQSITIRDDATGTTASIAPSLGFNCHSFRVIDQGEPVELLWSHPEFLSGNEKPSHSGIPLLFPFPGRLRGTELAFRQKKYSLDAGDGRGNAIHGYALNRPWQIVRETPSSLTGRFHASAVDPALVTRWPADFILTVTYEVAGAALRSRIEIENPDVRPLPWGFGTHPYFRVPLGAGGKAADCIVRVPTAEYWELSEMLPTGQRLPAEGKYELSRGLPFSETQFDDVFTALSFKGGLCAGTIDDPATRRRLVYEFGPEFREAVVYNPPHREAICIEPYTCVPDAYSLGGGADTGLAILEPGARKEAELTLRLDAIR